MPDIQGVVPYISPSDAPAAAAFYQKAFLATDVKPMLAEDGKRYMHCQFTVNGSTSRSVTPERSTTSPRS